MESEMILILVMISFALVFLSGYAAGYFRTLDLPLLGLYDSANDPDPVEDPDWARFLLGDGWIAIYEGVCN